MREFLDYSVAIARVRDISTDSFAPLGTGTMIMRNGRYGILTAHHCLHACNPEVRLGPGGTDTLLLVLRGGRCLIISADEVYEHQLTTPIETDYGPDLTFIEILPGPRLDSAKAISSFWNMNREAEEIKDEYGTVATPIASIGFPEIHYSTRFNGNQIHHRVRHMSYINAIQEGDVVTRNGWDYLHSTCNYDSPHELPQSFVGVSGGPVWGMSLRRNSDTGGHTIARSALIAVTFYQTELVDNKRQLRAHFIDSIYNNAWHNMG